MTESQTLILVLAAVYLIECLVWAPRRSIVFRSLLGRAFRSFDAGPLPGLRSTGFLLANPIPPFGTVTFCPWWPLSLSPDAVYSYVAAAFNPGSRPEQEGSFARFDEITHVAARERDLLVNGRRFLTTGSAGQTRHLATLLSRLKSIPAPRRAAAIEAEIRRMFDPGAIRSRLEEYRRRSRTLRWTGAGLFLYLFAVSPAIIAMRGLVVTWGWLLLGVLAFLFMIVWEFSSAHRALYPEARGDRWSHVLSMVLAPPAAIRAHDSLAKNLLEAFHPLAAASVLLPRDRYRTLASAFLRDVRFPIHPVHPETADGRQETELWFRTLFDGVVERFVARTEDDSAMLLNSPGPDSIETRAYCPRCLAQFVIEEGECDDCGGRSLEKIPPPDTATAR